MEHINDNELSNVNGGTQIPYIIKSGDTLGALAAHFHCTVDDICKWNNITDPDKISVGQKVIFKF